MYLFFNFFYLFLLWIMFSFYELSFPPSFFESKRKTGVNVLNTVLEEGLLCLQWKSESCFVWSPC